MVYSLVIICFLLFAISSAAVDHYLLPYFGTVPREHQISYRTIGHDDVDDVVYKQKDVKKSANLTVDNSSNGSKVISRQRRSDWTAIRNSLKTIVMKIKNRHKYVPKDVPTYYPSQVKLSGHRKKFTPRVQIRRKLDDETKLAIESLIKGTHYMDPNSRRMRRKYHPLGLSYVAQDSTSMDNLTFNALLKLKSGAFGFDPDSRKIYRKQIAFTQLSANYKPRYVDNGKIIPSELGNDHIKENTRKVFIIDTRGRKIIVTGTVFYAIEKLKAATHFVDAINRKVLKKHYRSPGEDEIADGSVIIDSVSYDAIKKLEKGTHDFCARTRKIFKIYVPGDNRKRKKKIGPKRYKRIKMNNDVDSKWGDEAFIDKLQVNENIDDLVPKSHESQLHDETSKPNKQNEKDDVDSHN